MRPTKIKLTNFGLATGEFDLSGIQLITGENRTGKSTLIRGIEFALTGTVWDAENDRNATFDELTASGVNTMSARLLFDDGFWIERRQVRENGTAEKVKVKSFIDFQGISSGALNQPRKAEQELGQAIRCSNYGIHLRTIIKAKPLERRRILLGMLIGEGDERPLTEWIFEDSTNIEGMKEADYKALQEIVNSIVDNVPDSMGILDRLYRLSETTETNLRESNKSLEATTALIKELGFHEGEKIDTSDIPEKELELEEFEKMIESLTLGIGSAEADRERSLKLQRDIEALKLMEKELGVISNPDDLKKEFDRLYSEDDERRGDEQKKADDLIATLKEKYDKRTADYKEELGQVDDRIAWIAARDEVLREQDEEIDNELKKMTMDLLSLSKDTKCPLCKSEIDTAIVTEVYSAEIENLKAQRNKIKGELINLTKENTDKAIDREEILDQIEIAEKEYSNAALTINQEITKTNELAHKEYEENLKPLNEQSKLILKADELATKRIDKEADLNTIQLVDDIEGQRDMLETRKQQKSNLFHEITKMKVAEHDARQKVNLEEKQFNEMVTVRCYKAIKKVVGPNGIQGQLLKERVEPFIKSVNDVLQSFAPDMAFSIQFQNDRGKESCQFGFTQRDDIYTLFESASGSEKALILFAIVIAIMNRERFVNQKIILMDDIEKMMHDMAGKLVNASKIVVEKGLVDSVIIAGALRSSDLELIQSNHADVFDSMITCKAI